MQEPTPRTSRLAIAGSFLALILIGGGGFLLGRGTAPAPAHTMAAPEPKPPIVPLAPPPPERVLGRADLIAIGNAAADAVAAGKTASPLLAEAAGKRFDLSLPFGCDGPAAEESEAPLRWRYDEESKALRVHVAPTDWPIVEWWRTPPPAVTALEGFWITRPWSSRETCASGDVGSAAPGVEPITLPGQTLGVAQLVTEETPRQLVRGGKAYETVFRVEPEALRVDAGLRVRARGRIASFPDGAPTRCTQRGGREQRPVCLIAVSLDEVAIENPETQEVLASWAPTIAGSTDGAR